MKLILSFRALFCYIQFVHINSKLFYHLVFLTEAINMSTRSSSIARQMPTPTRLFVQEESDSSENELAVDRNPLIPPDIASEIACLQSVQERRLDLSKRVEQLEEGSFKDSIKAFGEEFYDTFYKLYEAYSQAKKNALNDSSFSNASTSEDLSNASPSNVRTSPSQVTSSVEGTPTTRALQLIQDSPITQLEKNIKDEFKNLIQHYSQLDVFSGFNIDHKFIFRMFRHAIDESSEETPLSFYYYQSQLIHSIINRHEYIKQINDDISHRKLEILQDFFPHQAAGIRYGEVRFEITFFEADGHLGGKSPALITFYSEKFSKLLRLIYKPRAALMDQRIIEKFKQINKLNNKDPLHNRNPRRQLPVYDIHSYDNRFSMWEFIEGEKLPATSAENFIKNLKSCPGQQKLAYELEAGLLRLEAVCREMGISDFHGDNLILSGNQIVPIDLESLQSIGTGLYYTNPHIPEELEVTPQERQEIIKVFLDEKSEIEFRTIIIETGDFEGGSANPAMFNFFFDTVKKQLERKGIFVDASLKGLIMRDFLNNDIPYFLQRTQQRFIQDASGSLIQEIDEIYYATKNGKVHIGYAGPSRFKS